MDSGQNGYTWVTQLRGGNILRNQGRIEYTYIILYIYVHIYIYRNIPKMIYVFVCVAYVRVKRYDEIS